MIACAWICKLYPVSSLKVRLASATPFGESLHMQNAFMLGDRKGPNFIVPRGTSQEHVQMMALRARSEALCNAHGRLLTRAFGTHREWRRVRHLANTCYRWHLLQRKMVGTVFAELEWDKDKNVYIIP